MSGDKEKPKRTRGRKALRDRLDNAQPAPEPRAAGNDDTAPGWDVPDDYRGPEQDDWLAWHKHLPPHSPVLPLGVSRDFLYFIDKRGFLQEVSDNQLRDTALVRWFGEEFLRDAFPRYVLKQKIAVKTWDHSPAKFALVEACGAAGTFTADQRVRGRGCWRAADGGLIVHLGRKVMVDGQELKPGLIGAHVYPLEEPSLPAPEPMEADGEIVDDAGEQLLAKLRTWNWARGDLDAQLLLGWFVAAFLGGALKWRPMLWVTGDTSTGKSYLHNLVEAVMAPTLIHTADTTAAGLYQKVKLSALPIAVDELEAKANGQRAQAVLDLARAASAGSAILRGGSNHDGAEFNARSCMMFSSVLIPPMQSTDLNRQAILELGEVTAQSKADDRAEESEWRQWGSALRWRLMREWGRFPQTLAAYWSALRRVGHNERGADQFGTLLACADLALNGAAPTHDAIAEEGFVTRLDARELAETRLNVPDHKRCCEHLAGKTLDVFREGTKHSIAYWLRVGMQAENHDIHDVLQTFGLRLYNNPIFRKPPPGEPMLRGVHFAPGWHLAIANAHPQTAALYAGSRWEAPPGTTGVWVQALKRVRGAQQAKKWIDGSSRWSVVVPLSEFVDERAQAVIDAEQSLTNLEAQELG